MNKNAIDYSLYLVTDRNAVGQKDFLHSIETALEGGVTLVQLREKNISSQEFYRIALKVKNLTKKFNVPLIINDRIDIALGVGAEGVHLGQEDLPADVARQILGEDKIIGVSARTIEGALKAEKDGADYLGVGAMFATSTKDNTVQITPNKLSEIRGSVNIPIVAIGGINHSNLVELKDAKMDGIAVVSAILSSDNPKQASIELMSMLNSFT